MGVRAYTWRTEDGVTSEPVEIAPEPMAQRFAKYYHPEEPSEFRAFEIGYELCRYHEVERTKDALKALDAMIAAYEADWTDWSRKDAREHWEAIVAFSRDALAKAQA